MPGPFTTPVALSIPFEPNRNPGYGGVPSNIESISVQDAIEEVKQDALNNDRFLLLCSYGGNANTGRYLEIFHGQGSDISPLFSSTPIKILSVILQTTAAQATCNIGIFDLNVSNTTPVYTIVMVAQKRVLYVGTPLAALSANCLLAARVTSGSINSPTLQIFFSSNT